MENLYFKRSYRRKNRRMIDPTHEEIREATKVYLRRGGTIKRGDLACSSFHEGLIAVDEFLMGVAE